MENKSKKANEIFMKRVNNKLIKKGWDDTSKIATRKKNDSDKNVRNVYDRGDSQLPEKVKDGKISIDNLIDDIQMRAAVKMGLKKKRDMDKAKAVTKNNNINTTPNRSTEKAEDVHHYRFSDSKERKMIYNKYTFKLKDNNNNNTSPIIVKKDESKRMNDSDNFKTGERKKPLDKYTFRLRGESYTRGRENVTNGPIIVSKEENTKTNEFTECSFKTADKYFAKKQIHLEPPSKKFESINLEIKSEKRDDKATSTKKDDKDSQRKPIIKTIASKNDSKIYKAVTFANRNKKTKLQVNLPRDKSSKSTRESSSRQLSPAQNSNSSDPRSSKTSVKGKLKKKKNVRDTQDLGKTDIMQTEVAMWAPSSVNPHTQPYYEAWVDKTLTAISRLSQSDEAFMNHVNITQLYHPQRPISPELTYVNYADERYTGRIKVTQR